MAANSIIRYIRAAAKQADKLVQLTTLDGYYSPAASLMKWVSSLSSLTSLFVEDGSILTADVAKALRQKCPSFNYLQYHCCEGPEADQQLAEFLRDLKPQSLQTFVIRSRNEVGNETFMALQQHSSSLQKLCLMRLNPTALRSLHQLRHSLAITTLAIEGNDMVEGFGWLDYDNPADFEEVAEWLSKCASLRELLLARGSNATGLLLKIENNLGMIEDDSPVMELTSLNLDLTELNNRTFGISSETNHPLKI